MKKMVQYLISGCVGLLFISLFVACPAEHSKKTEANAAVSSEQNAQNEAAPVDQANRTINNQRQNAITRASAMAAPAVVGINVTGVKEIRQRSPFYSDDPFFKHYFGDLFKDRIYQQPIHSLGSGFIVSRDGYIITNNHVVENATKVIVTLPGGERHNAKIVGTDVISDVAVLKIDGEFPSLKWGDSDQAIVGEWVIALGNPFGLFELNEQPTVTVGVISALKRDWGRIKDAGPIYKEMIQTDAAINHGNSGGPLVNALGEVVGMNTFIYTGSSYSQGFVGIGFAIPINRVRNVFEQIRKYGKINRDFSLGIRVQDLTPALIQVLKLKVASGVIISQVFRNTSGMKAGLLSEDIILKLNNQKVTSAQQLDGLIQNMDLKVGDALNLEILRKGEIKKIQLKLLQRMGQ